MIKLNSSHCYTSVALIAILLVVSCKKYKDYNQSPELESLQQGLKLSAAVGYCVSVASSTFKGMAVPDNVTHNKGSGLIYIKIDKNHPLPFNSSIGDIIIGGLWNGTGGIISILFGNLDILNGQVKVYGLYLIPVQDDALDGTIDAVFFKQDIIIGNGSDTILNTNNISVDLFNARMNLFNHEGSKDPYVAIKQNFWIIKVDQANTHDNVYDDIITVNGGGQILEATGKTGGILYHAITNTKINYSTCKNNPISGFALSQNFKAGESFIDLGNSLLSFHKTCDGQAHVEFSTGKYVLYNGKNISLNLQ